MSNKKQKLLEKYINHTSPSYYTPLLDNIQACDSTVSSVSSTFFPKAFRTFCSLSVSKIEKTFPSLVLKLAMITIASGGFGAVMTMFTSGFIEPHTSFIDHSRSQLSQIKQHYHGYGRALKQSALGFAKFGFYIGLVEQPLELILGSVSTAGMFISGGLSALMLEHKKTFMGNFSRFMGNGLLICAFGAVLGMSKHPD